jgi:hypothetical protein
MKWFDEWFYKQAKKAWDNRDRFESEGNYVSVKEKRMNTLVGAQIDRGRPEGENRITFELSSAVGGRILNVRHYDERKDRHETQTYVIPSGEDVGERVAKIINLELFKQ